MKPLTKSGQMSYGESRTYLIFDKFRGTRVDTADTGCVLRGECCDDARPIAVQRGESLQVCLRQAQESVNLSKTLGDSRDGLDPSTSRRIASRGGQHGLR